MKVRQIRKRHQAHLAQIIRKRAWWSTVIADYEPDEDYGDGLDDSCHTCGGEGFLPEDEAELDWINFGDDLVECPNCGGSGLRSDCRVF
jgi:hypothetical protein